MIGKRSRIELRFTKTETNVNQLLMNSRAFCQSAQSSLRALVGAEVDKSEQQPLDAASALLGHFIHTDHYEIL
jgi:hypothetical protein